MIVSDEAWVACVLRGVSMFSQIRARSLPCRRPQWRCRPPPWVGGQRIRAGKNSRRNRPCRQQMRQKAHRARFFGDLGVALDIKASRRRHGAELADSRLPPLQARRGHASANKPRGKAVKGGRGPQMKQSVRTA